jgi:branched-chain amino acid aminotransferase
VTDALPMIWVNGQRQPVDGAHVSARDRGFTLADGVFETMKARNGTVFRLDQHLARLTAALRVLEIPVPTELREWVQTAIDAAALRHGVARLTVTRGLAPGGLRPPRDPLATVVMILTPMPPPAASLYEAGVSAQIASGRRNEHAVTSGLKTLAFTEGIVATLEAQRAGADEALFLDVAGHCSEGAASNLFIVAGRAVVTPPLTCGVLPGITRAAVLEIANTVAIRVEERVVMAEELTAADEAFLTSALRGVVPLVRVNGRGIGTATPGPITRTLSAAYAALVARECGA